jgi:HEAT repeat protein
MSITPSFVFAATLAVAAPAAAQATGPGPMAPPLPAVPPLLAVPLLAPVEMPGAPLRDGWDLVGFDQEAQERERAQKDREAERKQREREREAEIYESATEALDDSRWDRAIARFSQVAELKGTRADAALYWKGYAQNRAGQRADALATLAELTKAYPNSRYLKQARALEVEVRGSAGQPVRPENQADEDLKLMALQSLQHSDPEQAIPMIEKLLEGTASPRLKERALFVLAQSDSARAREILKNLARGNSTPELQSKAIQYLGVHGGPESRAALAEVYAASSDVDVKRRILRAFMVSGEKDRLLQAAQGEQNAELRAEAVRQLGVMGAHEELWQMYQKESALDVKKQILQAMFVGDNATRLIDLAKTEKNPELRRTAVRNLGLMGTQRTGDALVEIYNNDKDPEIRKAVVNGLFIQGNAAALVALARKEQDLAMKKEIVQKLSLMNDKIATDYMLELLNK